MRLYRINKLAKSGGAVIKTQDVLASSDREAMRRAESADCPVCEVLKDGKQIGSIV
jgi:hypothetical protein